MPCTGPAADTLLNILDLPTIKNHLDEALVLESIEKNFVAYSNGNSVVPPVGHLVFPRGDCHIKYGYIKDDPFFVIKVASGFHDNPQKGLNASTGLMLICSAETGEPIALLDDEGHLTDVRTAIAGAVAGKYLAASRTEIIGVVGAGVQAELQLLSISAVTGCQRALVWNRHHDKADALAEKFADSKIELQSVADLEELVSRTRHIVTTTPATTPLIQSEWVQPGTHITAVGADCPGKQELATDLVSRADVLVVDSVSQCINQGEIQTALAAGRIAQSDLIELGNVIDGGSRGRTDDTQITIADLTGVAVQDIAIAGSVYETWQAAQSN